MQSSEVDRTSELDFTEIQCASDSLDSSMIFHVIVDIIGFVLYMHEQIPSVMQDLSVEFDSLHSEYKELGLVHAQTELKAPSRRKHSGRMREVKHGIKRLEKLMNTVSNLQIALQTIISETPNIERVILILGSSPVRPQYVYEIGFSHGKVVPECASNFGKNKIAEAISRKAIRALISKGAGSWSYGGATKLFLLVKGPSSVHLPLHFLPKRDFRYCKKVVAFRLRFKCRTGDQEMNAFHYYSRTSSSIGLDDSPSNDVIWYQCRHVIKGLACKAPSTEE